MESPDQKLLTRLAIGEKNYGFAADEELGSIAEPPLVTTINARNQELTAKEKKN